MDFLGCSNHIGQVPENGFTLGLGDAHDARDKPWVEEQCVPPCDGVRSDQRMFGSNGVPTNWSADRSRVIRLHVCGMQGCQPLKVGLHIGRKHIVCSVL